MKIAVPVNNDMLDAHFGHCKSFALVDIDQESKTITARENIDAPPHEPGLLPRWLAERNVNIVITGGMGQKAKELFAEQSIDVIVGAPIDKPENLIYSYMNGALQSGINACDH